MTVLVAGVAALTAFVAFAVPVEAAPPPASDGTRIATTRTTGKPGKVVTLRKVEGSHSWDGFTWSPWVRQYGATVTRSPANQKAQRVCVTYGLNIWNGSSWWRQATRTGCTTIRAGASRVQLPRFDVAGLTRGNHFRMLHGYGWYNARTGKRLGTRQVFMNRQLEYVCNTIISTCYTGPGWVCVRSPGTGNCR